MQRDAIDRTGVAALGFAALGVVFGDIGTSPLYTLKTVLDLTGDGSPAAVLGVLSLIVWTLGRVPLCDRGRGALRRHGPFRRRADPASVVGRRVSEPDAQL